MLVLGFIMFVVALGSFTFGYFEFYVEAFRDHKHQTLVHIVGLGISATTALCIHMHLTAVAADMQWYDHIVLFTMCLSVPLGCLLILGLSYVILEPFLIFAGAGVLYICAAIFWLLTRPVYFIRKRWPR